MLGAPVVEDFRLVQRADGSLRLAVRRSAPRRPPILALQGLLRSQEPAGARDHRHALAGQAPTAKRRRVLARS